MCCADTPNYFISANGKPQDRGTELGALPAFRETQMVQERQDFSIFFIYVAVAVTLAKEPGKGNAEVQFIIAPPVEPEQLKGQEAREGGGER